MAAAPGLDAQVRLNFAMPERTRLLEDQQLDVVVEIRNTSSVSNFQVTANGTNITNRFGAPEVKDLDCDTDNDAVYRAPLMRFGAGNIELVATGTVGGITVRDTRTIAVMPFSMPARRRNVVLFIGDAMGTAYRDAARLVAKSVASPDGRNGMREGFFDDLLEMDKMPVSGLVMTYSLDRVTPDSANTSSAWATGNKAHTNGSGVFPDGTDCVWRTGGANASTLPSILDNPRVETLWEYLKRRYNYRTGIVSTADIADATPAGQAVHTAFRQTRYEVVRQYFENPMLGGKPAFDVILGGGWDQFMPNVRTDGRDMVQEFRNAGFRFVSTASELRNVSSFGGRVLGLFAATSNPRSAADGIRAASDPNMNVAYDKLGLRRPGSEPMANLGAFPDQPMLDHMTEKAIEVLSGWGGNQPFILMVEASSIDKQSHPNHAAGTIWDTIELDKAIGVARRFQEKRGDTLVLVTADHDQSMVVNGVAVVPDDEYFDRGVAFEQRTNAAVGEQTARVFRDVHTNIRSAYGFRDVDPNSGGALGPAAHRASPLVPALGYGGLGAYDFPNYNDADGDGYPENVTTAGRGNIRLSVAFRTGSHTGSSVPVTAEGPGAFLFTGQMDQTDLFFKMAVAVRGDTEEGDKLIPLLRSTQFPQTFGK
ncbi:MAG: alkaline phosphatase [Bryobacterales bacterium]|nr:alkaline phosphatase [Bryobacterales bacterium]